MGQLVVRNLDDAVIATLKARAAKDARSLEQVVRDILTDAARPSRSELLAVADAIRSRTKRVAGFDSTEVIRAWRDHDPSDR